MSTPGPAAALPAFLSDPRAKLLIFGGKGGVGKTTSATATALHIARARPDARVRLVSTDPAHSVADSLGTGQEPAAGTPAHIPPNLRVIELDTAAEHRAFMQLHGRHLREIAARGTFLDKDDIDRFLELSIPGLDEVMAFLRLADWVQHNEQDVLVVDTAPTGHTLRLLGMPEFLAGWLGVMDALLAKHRYMIELFGKGAPAGDEVEQFLTDLSGRLDNLGTLLRDHARCRFIPVMLAEAMSVLETQDLLASLDTLQISAPEIIVNRLIGEDTSPALRQWSLRQRQILSALPKAVTDRTLWGAPLLAEEVEGEGTHARFIAGLSSPTAGAGSPDQAPGFTAPEPDFPRAFGAIDLLAAAGLKLAFFAGKGGVGKTTMACAFAAVSAADAGKRTLIVSTDPAHSLADCVMVPLSGTPTRLGPNLEAIELDAAGEFAAFKALYAHELESFLDRVFQSMDMAFDREVMEKLLDLAPPGLDEVMALLRVTELLDGDQHDLIVLDTAPTGHLLRLLQLPELVEKWLQSIFAVMLKYQQVFRLPKFQKRLVEISRGVKKLRALLISDRSAIYSVAILTDMAFAETKDLVAGCGIVGARVDGILLNQATPPGPGPLTAGLRTREDAVRQRFAHGFKTVPQTVVHRWGEPRGLVELLSLGRAIAAAPSLPVGRFGAAIPGSGAA